MPGGMLCGRGGFPRQDWELWPQTLPIMLFTQFLPSHWLLDTRKWNDWFLIFSLLQNSVVCLVNHSLIHSGQTPKLQHLLHYGHKLRVCEVSVNLPDQQLQSSFWSTTVPSTKRREVSKGKAALKQASNSLLLYWHTLSPCTASTSMQEC
jgi:hypothetical protein